MTNNEDTARNCGEITTQLNKLVIPKGHVLTMEVYLALRHPKDRLPFSLMTLRVLGMMSSITALAHLAVCLPYGPNPSQTQQRYRDPEANIGALGLKTMLMAGVSTRGGAFDNRSQKTQRIYTGETWVQKFCRTPGNEFFVEVNEQGYSLETLYGQKQAFKSVAYLRSTNICSLADETNELIARS